MFRHSTVLGSNITEDNSTISIRKYSAPPIVGGKLYTAGDAAINTPTASTKNSTAKREVAANLFRALLSFFTFNDDMMKVIDIS